MIKGKYYCIINSEDLTKDMLKESINNGRGIKQSRDESKVILKFNTAYPQYHEWL